MFKKKEHINTAYKQLNDLYIKFLEYCKMDIETNLGKRRIEIRKTKLDHIIVFYDMYNNGDRECIFIFSMDKEGTVRILESRIPVENIYLALCEANQIFDETIQNIDNENQKLSNLISSGFTRRV